MTEPLTLSVGIVTYESPIAVLEELLVSLQAAIRWLAVRHPVSTTVHVICNDEEPTHAEAVAGAVSRAALCSDCAIRFELLHGHGNVGYGAAQNIVIDQVSSDYHLVLNPDIVMDREALAECVAFLEEDAETVMLTPQGFDANAHYASLAKRRPSVLVLLLRALSVRPSDRWWGREVGRYIYSDRLPSSRPELVDYASGCFMFCRTAPLKAVGGFDPRYFLYFEDYDLSKRLSQHGYIYELPNVKIRHYGGMTVRRGWRRIRYFVRSAFLFFGDHGWRVI